jgi:hypothetical protein
LACRKYDNYHTRTSSLEESVGSNKAQQRVTTEKTILFIASLLFEGQPLNKKSLTPKFHRKRHFC